MIIFFGLFQRKRRTDRKNKFQAKKLYNNGAAGENCSPPRRRALETSVTMKEKDTE